MFRRLHFHPDPADRGGVTAHPPVPPDVSIDDTDLADLRPLPGFGTVPNTPGDAFDEDVAEPARNLTADPRSDAPDVRGDEPQLSADTAPTHRRSGDAL